MAPSYSASFHVGIGQAAVDQAGDAGGADAAKHPRYALPLGYLSRQTGNAGYRALAGPKSTGSSAPVSRA